MCLPPRVPPTTCSTPRTSSCASPPSTCSTSHEVRVLQQLEKIRGHISPLSLSLSHDASTRFLFPGEIIDGEAVRDMWKRGTLVGKYVSDFADPFLSGLPKHLVRAGRESGRERERMESVLCCVCVVSCSTLAILPHPSFLLLSERCCPTWVPPPRRQRTTPLPWPQIPSW
jgi:hypothetical protein